MTSVIIRKSEKSSVAGLLLMNPFIAFCTKSIRFPASTATINKALNCCCSDISPTEFPASATSSLKYKYYQQRLTALYYDGFHLPDISQQLAINARLNLVLVVTHIINHRQLWLPRPPITGVRSYYSFNIHLILSRSLPSIVDNKVEAISPLNALI